MNFASLISNNVNTLILAPLASFSLWVMRQLFGTIDSIVYSFIAVLYNLLMDLANAVIINNAQINDFMRRMYVIIGVVMLFKITFSLVTYVVSPEQFTDKNKGVQKLIQHVIISLVLIIVTPWGFSMLYDFQSAILTDQIIPNFILGVDSDSVDANMPSFVFSDRCCEKGTNGKCLDNGQMLTMQAQDQGNYIAMVAFRPFFQPSPEAPDSSIPSSYCTSTQVNGITVGQIIRNELIKKDIKDSNGDKTYVIEYRFFLSTVIGIFIALIFVSFCFDVAIRSIKLAFLQLIAPIPILSYIDPKSGKDTMLMKWFKDVGTTWAGLFIRLAAVFFGIYIISLVGKVEAREGTQFLSSKFWMDLFVIIGALMFAKQLPKLIEQLTGFKVSGSFKLNPFDRVREEALGGKAIVTGAGALGAAGIAVATGGIGGAWAAKQAGMNMLKGFSTGATSGLTRGLSGGLAAKGKGIVKAGRTAGQAGAQNVEKFQGTTFRGRSMAGAQTALGISTKADQMDAKSKTIEEYAKLKDTIDEIAAKEILKDSNSKLSDFSYFDAKNGVIETDRSGANFNTVKAAYDKVMKDQSSTEEDIQTAESKYQSALKQAKNDYINRGKGTVDAAGTLTYSKDQNIEAYINSMNRIAEKNYKDIDAFKEKSLDASGNVIRDAAGNVQYTGRAINAITAEQLGDVTKEAKTENVVLKSGAEYETAQRTRDAVKKK